MEGNGNQTGLASMFSSSTLSKFARKLKPQELVPEPRPEREPVLDPEDQEKARLKMEKRKVKRAKRYDALEKAEQAAISRNKTSEVASTGKSDTLSWHNVAAAPASKISATPSAASASSSSSSSASSSSSSAAQRSIFIGNVPLVTSTAVCEKEIYKLCTEKYGAVESVRARSLPIAGTAVDEAGNQALVRRVCAHKNKMGTQKQSVNIYVVFESKNSVELALKDNNMLMGEGKHARHIRIDRSTPTAFPPALSVFLGGLPLYADEEEVRAHFAATLPNGQDDICDIRLVRDAETMIGKGIGFLHVSDSDAVIAALSLHEQKFKKRWALRVTPCAKRTKNAMAGADGTLIMRKEAGASDKKRARNSVPVEGGSVAGGGAVEGAGETEGEESTSSRKGKKRPPPGPAKVPPKGAPRRLHKAKKAFKSAGGQSGQKITQGLGHSKGHFKGKGNGKGKLSSQDSTKPKGINLKNTMTRKKVLKERGQMKEKKGQKGKRLGGNVKKAMKASKGKVIV